LQHTKEELSESHKSRDKFLVITVPVSNPDAPLNELVCMMPLAILLSVIGG
jgi:hypothetical protein